jgi:Permeases of the major facilitator superfamily
MKNKKQILAWAMYDWANSAFATTVVGAFFPIFFSQYWSAGAEKEVSTFFLGAANSAASVIVALLSPILGAIADRGGKRKKFLIFFLFLGILNTSLLFVLKSGQWQLAIFLYVLASVGFSGGNTFYDSLLPGVADEDQVDFVSSLGYSLGYIGGGLLFLLNVLMYIFPTAFGLADGVEAVKLSFLMVGLWWFIFALPILLIVREKDDKGKSENLAVVKDGLREIKTTFKEIRKLKYVALFLVAYWCYIDGVDTIIRMAVDYGTSLDFPSSSLIIALLITQFVAFPAALLYHRLGARIGIRNALALAIGAYMLITVMGVFMTRPLHFYLLAVGIGLFQGGIQALSRSFFSRLIPKGKEAQFFGFFNMLGKFAAIIGPLLIGLVTLITKSNRLGILSLLILFAVGLLLLLKLDEKALLAK